MELIYNCSDVKTEQKEIILNCELILSPTTTFKKTNK